MKKKLIASILLLILIFQNLLVLLPLFEVEATTNVSYVEFELRQSDSAYNSNGAGVYAVGDTVSVDVYMVTPNVTVSECEVRVKGPSTSKALKISDVVVNPELSSEIQNCIEVSTYYTSTLNYGRFIFDGTDSEVYITNTSELKLATVTFTVEDYDIEINGNDRYLELLNIGLVCETLKNGTKSLSTLCYGYNLYASQVPTSVVATCTNKNILVGEEASISANVYSSGSYVWQDVTYSSSNSNIVKVYDDGTIRGMVPGFATITISSAIKPTVSTEIVVTVSSRTSTNPITSIEVTNKPSTMKMGETLALQTTFTPSSTDDYTLKYESSNTEVATIDTNGRIEAISTGTTTITVYSINNITDSFELTVVNPVTSIEITNPIQYIKLGNSYVVKFDMGPSDLYKNLITYSSSKENIATINDSGTINALDVGVTKITISAGEVEDHFFIFVVPSTNYVELSSVEITNKIQALKLGESYTLTTSITPTNASNTVFKFSSSDESVATIDENGTITALSLGKTTITARIGYRYDSFEVTINEEGTEIPLTSIKINYGDESNLSLLPDTYLFIGAEITPSDTTESTDVIWSSSNEDIIEIDSDGLLYTIQPGKATITAKVGSLTDSVEFTVIDNEEEPEEDDKEDEPQTPIEAEIVAYYTINENIKATLDKNGILKITGIGDMPNYTSNSTPWYSNCSDIKKVVVESGITSIGNLTFQDCTSLKELELPTTLTEVGEGVFYNCSSLESFTAPSSLTVIGKGMFVKCNSLKNVNLNEGLTTIGQYAFQETAIETLTIPASVKSISDSICWGTTTIKEFIVKEGNTEFYTHEGVLYNKPSNSSANILLSYPIGNTRTEYTIPDGVTRIEEFSFWQAKNIKTVNFPSTITWYGTYAFSGSGVTSLVIPESKINYLSSYVWADCVDLKTVDFKGSLTESRFPLGIFANCTSLETVTISGTVEEIYADAFRNCTALKTANLTGEIETICYSAFNGCSSLEKVVWPESIVSVSKTAFKGCDKLTETYPDGFILQDDGYYRLPPTTISITGYFDYEKTKEVLDLVNQERANAGLEPLVMDQKLFEVANQRASEIAIRYSHTRPDASDCFSIFPEIDYSQITGSGVLVSSAENIASGFSSAESVMNGWMNSAGHRGNILNSSFKYIGIGCFYQNGKYYWVQCFLVTGEEMTEYPNNETKKLDIDVALSQVDFTFSQSTLTIGAGKTSDVKIYGYYNSSEGTTRFVPDFDNFNFEVEDTSIATFSDGTVTTIKDGTTTIKATSKKNTSLTATLTVNVKTYCSAINVPSQYYVITKNTPISDLGIYVTPNEASQKTLEYSISNTEIATISNNTIVPLQNGTTYLIVKTTDGSNITKRIILFIEDLPVQATGLTLNTNNITITSTTQSSQIVGTFTPSNTTNKNLSFIVNNNDIATVDSNGYVRGKSNGSTYITVSTTDGSNLTATVNVTVNISNTNSNDNNNNNNNDNNNVTLPFKDIKNSDWCYEAVSFVYQKRYILGTSSTTYEPGTKLTRGMIVTILHRMEGENKVSGNMKFPDVSSKEYYYEAVKWASANGIVNGYGDGTFKPNKAVTREELAVILRNYTRDYKGENTDSITANLNTFADGNKVSSYAVSAVQWAVGSGVITGYSHNNTVAPQGTATRDIAASMLYKYCNRKK